MGNSNRCFFQSVSQTSLFNPPLLFLSLPRLTVAQLLRYENQGGLLLHLFTTSSFLLTGRRQPHLRRGDHLAVDQGGQHYRLGQGRGAERGLQELGRNPRQGSAGVASLGQEGDGC